MYMYLYKYNGLDQNGKFETERPDNLPCPATIIPKPMGE